MLRKNIVNFKRYNIKINQCIDRKSLLNYLFQIIFYCDLGTFIIFNNKNCQFFEELSLKMKYFEV